MGKMRGAPDRGIGLNEKVPVKCLGDTTVNDSANRWV